ncbi:VOC family protein [Streptomyces sp. NPDC051985]|uniref:VOC family protein n=1 Tax=Streptomyces sp. NPDC051985 TaxID=3155807 RepID=UPI0034313675
MGLHHVGLRVTDLDRSTAFYQALGGEILTAPFELSGRGAALAMTAPPSTRIRIALLGFRDGGGVELFDFGAGDQPSWLAGSLPSRDARLPHVGIQVDDVDDALERAERAGGARLWPRPSFWGTVRVVYLRDPDGNVVELLDGPLTEVAAAADRSRAAPGG